MSIHALSSVAHHLSTPTGFFGLKLWITILICIGLLIIFILVMIFLCYFSSHLRESELMPPRGWDMKTGISSPAVYSGHSDWLGSGRDHVVDMVCKSYSARELHLATNGFSQGNMISSGDHGEVYRAILFDNKRVAIKKFLSKSDNVDEFIEEVEAIWCIRHKNLVKLLGYSIEGDKRMLVYDYIDNGDLHQWLHGCTTRTSPLTWNIRMNIVLGIAKGLVYLHEDSEPIVVHKHLTSSSILLDRQWNPKISYIGITNLLRPKSIARSLSRMSGYIDPDYNFTCPFNEKNDIYSFGVVIMEIITGKIPMEFVEFSRKEYLVEWVKSKVCDQKLDDIVDPSLQEVPSSKELKRILLIALRCVDPEVENRPTIGDVIHMLQPRDLLLDDVSRNSSLATPIYLILTFFFSLSLSIYLCVYI
uniref:non-specific serine/threonine protein kinase n=1 Tax=Helianthus annuus TaxID=4232 RepID=A0A251SMN1_HELAN